MICEEREPEGVVEDVFVDEVMICLELGGRGWSLYRTSQYLIESFCNIKNKITCTCMLHVVTLYCNWEIIVCK